MNLLNLIPCGTEKIIQWLIESNHNKINYARFRRWSSPRICSLAAPCYPLKPDYLVECNT